MATVHNAAPAAEPAAASPGRKKIAFAAVALVAVLGLAGALVLVLRGNVAMAPKQVELVKPIFVAIEPVTVNLQSDGKPRFLHLGVTIKVKDGQAQARIAESLPELRSRLLVLLSNRDPATLASAADKARLAEEIRNELNRPAVGGLPPYGVTGVAFNAFVVQ